MRRYSPNTYERPWLVLCEGPGDQKLLSRLIGKHIPDSNFQIEYVEGNGGFASRLSLLLETSTTFKSNVKAVLIVSDKDDDPAKSFERIKRSLQDVGFPSPDEPSVCAKKPDYPDIVILMVPIRNDGNIETLCLEAMWKQWNCKAAVDAYISATPSSGWGVSKKSKAKMHALLAGICEQSPDVRFEGIWNLSDKYHLDLDHDCFEELVRFFQNFGRLIAKN